MSEMNERDLRQVSGGGTPYVSFSSGEWNRRNCRACTIFYNCPTKKQQAAVQQAEEQAKNGVEWNCPDRRLH